MQQVPLRSEAITKLGQATEVCIPLQQPVGGVLQGGQPLWSQALVIPLL